ncbi:hypothetical protein OX284_013290 [Flavobacterium sp. SUN046]|uniref:hypothetical protein n=1 Tax=Flavobacterium sp. SUN046 TaxID=3002440 RepID=UPI002DC033C7|nr:hypothetical protein [Flavobacterium sp. SUN046]MEC4050411.1 hypothetical protein [Flavobacterium sp. SUN046]
MRQLAIYLALSLCLFASKMMAQDTNTKGEQEKQTFEAKARAIADKIEKITTEEKINLKNKVEEVNVQLEKGLLTTEQAEVNKKKLAESSANTIENKIASVQNDLSDLIQQKVDGKITAVDTTKIYGKFLSVSIGDSEKKKNKSPKPERRTTSQFLFALGLNNVVTNGSVDKSDFRYFGSHFYEWGVTWNTRMLKNDNLMHLKYGFSVMYNNLRPTENRSFVVNGNQTNLEVNPVHQDDSRFKNVYLVVPLHLEFDLSKGGMHNDTRLFKTHQGARLGLGGYIGTNLKSKQYLNYDNDGYSSQEITKGDFNTNNFIYGLSAYIGYKETSLYLKYDMNPLFQNNTIKQNNVSLGVRFDLN